MSTVTTRAHSIEDARQAVRATQVAQHPTIAAFHDLFYQASHTWGMSRWRNIPVMKAPTDLWIYQEIIWDTQPDLILETGTAFGGSAEYFADMLRRHGQGIVWTVDTDPRRTPAHHAVRPHVGSSINPATVALAQAWAQHSHRVMVVLDSDHRASHVAQELALYAPLVTPGCYLVVEDTNVQTVDGEPGPWPAVEAFLLQHPEFVIEPMAERYLLTFNPGGWLRRVA